MKAKLRDMAVRQISQRSGRLTHPNNWAGHQTTLRMPLRVARLPIAHMSDTCKLGGRYKLLSMQLQTA